jgi:hypothetical protein
MLKKLEQEHNIRIKVTEDEDLDQDEYEFYAEEGAKSITSKYQ